MRPKTSARVYVVIAKDRVSVCLTDVERERKPLGGEAAICLKRRQNASHRAYNPILHMQTHTHTYTHIHTHKHAVLKGLRIIDQSWYLILSRLFRKFVSTWIVLFKYLSYKLTGMKSIPSKEYHSLACDRGILSGRVGWEGGGEGEGDNC